MRQGSLSIKQFMAAFKAQTGLEVVGLVSPVAFRCKWSEREKDSLEAPCGCSATSKNIEDKPTAKQCTYNKCKGRILYSTVMFGTMAEFLKEYSDKPMEISAQVIIIF